MRFSITGWAGQLSMIRTIVFESFVLLSHPFFEQLRIHPALFLGMITARKALYVIETAWFCDFPMKKIGRFSPTIFAAARPVNRILLFFPPQNFSPFKLRVFSEKLDKVAQTHQHWICFEANSLIKLWVIRFLSMGQSFLQ